MSKSAKKKASSGKKKQEYSIIHWPLSAGKSLWLSVGLILLISLVAFWRFVSGEYLFLFEDIGSDTLTVFYPNMVHLARYIREVGFPGWSFYMGPGQGIYPSGLLNPFDWIYFPMGPKAIAHSITYVQLLKLVLSGVIFALFLRKTGVADAVMVIGGILYAFGGYLVVGSGWYVHTTHIFWMTVALLGFEMLLRDQRWWLFPIPFVFLAGTRGYFLILFMTLYAAVRTIDYYGLDWKKILRVYGRMAICGVLALMLTAPFLGGKVSKLKDSPRVTGDVSKVESLRDKPMFEMGQGKHNPTAILRWFSSDLIGTGDTYKGWRNYLEGPLFYIGLLSLLLLPQFFWLADKRQKWLYGGFLLFWLLLIVFPWFRYAFYAFAGNYYKGALSLFIPFSVLLVAMMALDRIVREKAVHLPVLGVTLALCLGALWYPYASLPEGIVPGIRSLVTVFLVLQAVLLAGFNFQAVRNLVFPVLLGVVCIETAVFSSVSNNRRTAVPAEDLAKPVRHFDETWQALEYVKRQENPMFYRTDKIYGSVKTGYNDALVQDFFGTKMYQSHNSKYYVGFLEDMGVIPRGNEASSRWLVGVSKRSFLHPLMSIQYVLSKKETRGDLNKDMYQLAEKTGQIEIYKSKYFIPFGIPFDQYIRRADFMQLGTGQKMEAIYHGIVLEDESLRYAADMPLLSTDTITYGGNAMPRRWTNLAQKSMKMNTFEHNHITGTIDIESPSVLFFSLVYDEAWHVWVNGQRKELLLVDLGFSGIKLEPGSHSIELKYIPPMSRWGWLIFAAGLAIGGFLLVKKIRILPID